MIPIDIMKQVMARIDEAFTTIPDNQRAYTINGYDVIIKYNGWYKWCVSSIDYESEDFEFFHGCLQDAIDTIDQTVSDHYWLLLKDGKITRAQYDEFLQEGANYEITN